MLNYVQPGHVLTHTPTQDVKSGELVMLGDTAAVAVTDIPANASGSVQISGVFRLPKAAGAITQGAAVFDDGTGQISTADSGTPVGIAAHPAADAATEVEVLLNGLPGVSL